MAKPRYEYCELGEIRASVEERLQMLPARKGEDESPMEFWSRVERAGLLPEALALYNQIAAASVERRHTRRETKKEFDRRTKREGRQGEAKRMRAKLLASGLTEREAQVKLVERMQPLDGTKTRAWETPDPWEAGRLFKKKADQQAALKLTKCEKDEDDNEGLNETLNRLYWAERRREERQALADARRRARGLKLEQERLQQPLLRTRVLPDGQVRTPDADHQKARRRVRAAKHSSPRLNDDGDKLPSVLKAEIGAPQPTGIQRTRPTARQRPTRPVLAPEVIVPQISSEPVQKPKRLAPLLCPRCRTLGYANCRECMLATDSSLAIEGNVISQVRQPTEQDLWPWHRCECCDNCFKAPQYPALTLCPDCVANGAH
jgi:hypothetical protein